MSKTVKSKTQFLSRLHSRKPDDTKLFLNIVGQLGEAISRASKHLPAAIVAFSIAAIFTRPWFNSSTIPGGTDAVQYASTSVLLSKDLRFLFIWQSVGTGGQWLIGFANLLAFFNSLLNNPILTVKVVFFGCIFVSYLTAYFLCLRVSGRWYSAMVASIIYVGSQPFARILSTGTLSLAFTYSLAPLSLLLLILASTTGSWRWAFSYSITDVLIVIARPDFIIYWIPMQSIVLIGVLFRKDGFALISRVIRVLKVLGLSGVFFLLLTAFEWLPLVLGPIPRYLKVSSVPGSFQGQDILSSILLLSKPGGYMASYLGATPTYTLASISITLYLVVAAIVAVFSLGVLLYRRDSITASFALATGVCIFFAKGPNEPLGLANLWLFTDTKNWPLTLLYDTTRWLMPVSLGYTVLCSLAISGSHRRAPPDALSALFHNIRKIIRQRLKTSLSFDMSRIRQVSIVGIIVGISLSSILLVPVPWTHGLCSLNPYRGYTDPYSWLSSQPDHGMVFPVPYANLESTGPWLGSSCAGWHNDLGFVSTLWSDKASLYPGGTPSNEIRYTTEFFDNYIGALLLNNGTSNIGRILGPVGVGYFVVDGYPPTEIGLPGDLGMPVDKRSPFYQQEFFLHQPDIIPVYAYGNSTVYANPYWKPVIFRSGSPIFVVGQAQTLTYLASAKIDLASHPLVFLDQNPNLFDARPSRIVFADSSLLDLAMLVDKPQASIDLNSAMHFGFNVLSDPLSVPPYNAGMYQGTKSPLLYANNDMKLVGKFSTPKSGRFELWVHGVLAGSGSLTAQIDDSEGNTTALSDYVHAYPHWVRLSDSILEAGPHSLTIYHTDTGRDTYVVIDSVSLYPEGELQNVMSSLESRLSQQSYETNFLFGSPTLMRTMSRPNSFYPRQHWYDSPGGIAVFSEFGASGVMDLSGAKPSQYDVIARVGEGITHGNITVQTEAGRLSSSFAGRGVVNDANLESAFWTNLNPGYEVLQDVQSSEGPETQLAIEVQGSRPAYSLVQKDYSSPLNWSAGRYISISIRSTLQNDVAQVYFYFGNNRTDYARYDIPLSSNWHTFDLDKTGPDSSVGIVNWANVTRVRIATADKQLGKTLYLNPLLVSNNGSVPNTFQWINLGRTYLSSYANVTIHGSLWLDQILFVQDDGELKTSLDEASNSGEPVDWRQESPTSFVVSADEREPFTLMFQQTFDTRWVARIGSMSITPTLTDRFMMSYELPPGKYEVRLTFEGDFVQWVGYGISFVTIVAVFLACIIPRPPIGFRKNTKGNSKVKVSLAPNNVSSGVNGIDRDNVKSDECSSFVS